MSTMVISSKSASPQKALQFLSEHQIQFVDFRFTDFFGTWQHLTFPVDCCTEDIFTHGIGFDGSSIRGFQHINDSDMLLKPDPTSGFIDPFMQHPTAVYLCNIYDPITGQPYDKDPRFIAQKAEEYLLSTGIATKASFGPEAEFFLFDKLKYENHPNKTSYEIDCEEAAWNSASQGTFGLTLRPKGGYFPCPPLDRLHNIRSEMVLRLKEIGVRAEMHHHEVAGAGQCEINIHYGTLTASADQVQKYKYAVRNTATEHGLIANFMPKPVMGDNGSGMHLHLSLWKDDQNLMFKEDNYAGLSDIARWYIGGILKHAAALLAFCAPTTNSYRRLVPGYEAPINLIYSMRNRSACVRIPMYDQSAKSKRIEFRAPDPSANPYLAFSACLMAGIDGIQNKIEPPKPMDKDLYELPRHEKAMIPQTPGSLRETLIALRKDHTFLLQGNVFTSDVIETYINYKIIHECDALDLRPHPYEFYLYADI